MVARTPDVPNSAHQELPAVPPHDDTLIDGFVFHCLGKGLSQNTVYSQYEAATVLLSRWAAGQKLPGLQELKRGDIDAWLVWLRLKARTRRGASLTTSYINNLYRGIQQFYRWLESDIDGLDNPMAKMTPPKIEEKVIPVIQEDQIVTILKSASKCKWMDDYRNYAILRLFLACGVRLEELTRLKVEDIDIKMCRMLVTGKGSKQRYVKFDQKTGGALHKWLRERAHHNLAARSSFVWLGTNHRGPLTNNGMRQIITRHAEKAGFKINPHMFRHTFSHKYLLKGGNEGDLMELMGWSSPAMARRYAKSAAAERAQRSYDRIDVMGGL